MTTKIAPYNNAMRLGQGFNSYTHRLCIDNAVNVGLTKFEAGDAQKQSQVVSYSSRFVSKLSEVVETMNISLSSAIKRGTVEISGNVTVVDEDTFGAADLNAVVSVKVVNQTTIVKEDSTFTALPGIKPQDEQFNNVYGDCYISGFIYGGELTGIVSVKVHDRTNITGTTNRIKSSMSGAETEVQDDFILKDPLINASRGSMVAQAMQETESTISVNWMGGGQIKRADKLWDIETLFETAATFPSSVASCPQRTWAILTPYTSNRSFVEFCTTALSPPKSLRYDLISGYTAELFDNFMDYKKLLKRLQDIISRRSQYQAKSVANAITLDISVLVSVRQALRDEQSKIVEAVEVLSRQPSMLQRTAAWSFTDKDFLVKSIIAKALGQNALWKPSPGVLVDALPLLPVTTSNQSPATASAAGTGTSTSSSASGVSGGGSGKGNVKATGGSGTTGTSTAGSTTTPAATSSTTGSQPAASSTSTATPASSSGTTATSQTSSLIFNFETLIPPAIWEDLLPEPKSGSLGSALASQPNLGSGVSPSTTQPSQQGGTSSTNPAGPGLVVTRTAEDWNKLLQDTQNKLTVMTSERDALTKKLTEAATTATALQKSIDTLTATNKTQAGQITQKDATIAQLTTDKNTINTKLTTAETGLNSKNQEAGNLQNQINRLTAERNDLQKKWDSIPSFNVLSATWGPRQLAGNRQVVAKLEDFAKNKGRTLNWTNDYFGGDPWEGKPKWGSVIWYFKLDSGLSISRFEGWENQTTQIK